MTHTPLPAGGTTPGILPTALGCLLILLLTTAASAAILVGKGNDPVADHNWPAGSLVVANLKTRVGWWEGPPFGGGQHNFLYRGDAKTFQEALDAFAKIKAPGLELFVHEGPNESVFLKDDKDPKSSPKVDWSFTVWNPQNWNRLYNNPDSHWNAEDPNFRGTVPPPRMDVYVADEKDGNRGGIDWSQVKVPANVTVTDDRASAHGFAGGSVVVGDVYDLVTSKPVPGARVTLAKNKGQNEKHEYVWETVAEAKAGDNGHFEVKNVPEGTYRVTVSAPGMAPRVLGYESFGKNTYKQYAAKVSGATTLAGTAIDTDGKPLAGITVRADAIMGPDGRGYDLPERPQATTDAQGKFALQGLPRGHCQLHAYSKAHLLRDVLKVYEVPSGDVALTLVATGSVKFKVTKADGTPAADAQVSMEPEGGAKVGKWGGSGNVSPDGTLQFDSIPPGKYVASISPGLLITGKDPNAKTVEIKAGETAEVNFTRK